MSNLLSYKIVGNIHFINLIRLYYVCLPAVGTVMLKQSRCDFNTLSLNC